MSDVPGAGDGAPPIDPAAEPDDLDFLDEPEGEEAEAPEDEAEGEEAPPEDEAEQPVARQGRKPQAQRWRERAERTETTLQTVQRELAELRARQTAPPPIDQERLQRERMERWSMMAPHEIVAEAMQIGRQEVQQQLQYQQLQTQDLIDRQTYDAAAQTSRVHQQYRQRVDDLLQSERARGNLGASRQNILAYLVGQDAIARAGRAAPAQRNAAGRRVVAATARPTGARGEGARGSRTPAAGTP